MKSTLARSLVLALGLMAIACAFKTASMASQPTPKRTRAEFMRQKLDFSKEVLEGLVLEQYDTITKSAKALKKLSEAAEWEVPTIPNATDYVMLTSEFQRYADDLVKQAKDKNVDGATIAYFKLTTTCVQCHKYIRNTGK